jgi:hypothetical protein
MARQSVAAFNAHTRACPYCAPPAALCWLGAELDAEASQASAAAMWVDAQRRRDRARIEQVFDLD